MKGKRLALFFTLGVSLRLWDEMGHLSRETRIYKHLADYLGEVYFLTYGAKDLDYRSKIAPIKVLPKPRGIPIKLSSLLAPLMHWKMLRKVDFLKTNQMPGAWAAVIAKLLFRKKLIVRCGYEWEFITTKENKNKWKLWLIHIIEWICYHYADAIILASEYMKRYVCSAFGISPEKVTVIPNYIDTDLFQPLELEKVPGRLIFAGRFSPEKNLLNLLKAIEDLPDVELVLVGDGPLRESLQEYSTRHGLNVVFKGRVPNEQLPVILNTAEVFVLPSLYEGNPKALLEAMACGLPVIATPVEGNREIVKHKENGYITANTSPEALREAIIEVLSDPKLRAKMGERARIFVKRNFALDTLINRELRLLERLINGGQECL